MNSTFMKEKPVGPLLASMALPMVFSMLVNSLYNIVDSFFVAQISEQAIYPIYLSHQSQQHISGSHIVSAGCIDPIQTSACHNDQRKLIRIYVHSSSQCIDDL